MAKKLKVWVHERKSPSSPVETFGPDSKLPEWLLERIEGKDHLFEPQVLYTKEVKTPAPRERESNFQPSAVEKLKANIANEPIEGDEEVELEAPKRNGSEVDWREFLTEARKSGEYPLDADADYDSFDRAELIKAAEDAGVIDPK